jgi:hypothetical protein
MLDRKQAVSPPPTSRPSKARTMAGDGGASAGHAVQALHGGRVPTASALIALQRAAGNGAVAAAMEEGLDGSMVRQVVAGGGQPLDPAVQRAMETQLGADLSDVRVHTDAQATQSALAINAEAYTAGNHVVFQRQLYQPGTHAGLHMIAHELSHVVQQREGPVSGSPISGGVSVSDPGDRFEQSADRTADFVMRSIDIQGGINAFQDDDVD